MRLLKYLWLVLTLSALASPQAAPVFGAGGVSPVDCSGLPGFIFKIDGSGNPSCASSTGVAFKVNGGSSLTTGGTVNFQNGLNIAITNPSAGNIAFAFSGTLPANTPSVAHQFFTAYNSTTGAYSQSALAKLDLPGVTVFTDQGNVYTSGTQIFKDNSGLSIANSTDATKSLFFDLSGLITSHGIRLSPVDQGGQNYTVPAFSAGTHLFVNGFGAGGFLTGQPAFGDLTGTATDGQLGNAYSGIGTCTNQVVTVLGRNAAPTCTTVTSAYVNSSIAQTGVDINTLFQVTATHLASALPVAQGGTAVTDLSFSGTQHKVLSVTGALTNGDCLKVNDVNGNAADAGSPCGSGGGAGTVNSASANSLGYYASTGTAISGSSTISVSNTNGTIAGNGYQTATQTLDCGGVITDSTHLTIFPYATSTRACGFGGGSNPIRFTAPATFTISAGSNQIFGWISLNATTGLAAVNALAIGDNGNTGTCTVPGSVYTCSHVTATGFPNDGSIPLFIVNTSSGTLTSLADETFTQASTQLNQDVGMSITRGTDGSWTLATASDVPRTDIANSYTAGAKQTMGASATTAGLALAGVGADPSSLGSGDIWSRSDRNYHQRVYDGTTVHEYAFTTDSITGNAANVTGTVATANGGTGLTSSGGAGSYLRSNGSVWASTTIAGGDLPASVVQTNQANSYTSGTQDLNTVDQTSQATNDTTTGTGPVNTVIKLTSTGAISAGTGDTGGSLFIADSGTGTTGSVKFSVAGQVPCKMDATTSNTEGFYVVNSTTVAKDCHAQSGSPSGVTVLGYMISNSTTAGSTATVEVIPFFAPSSGGGAGTVTNIATTAPLAGGPITTTGTLSITGAAGQVLAGATPAFTATPVLGVAGTTVGSLGFQNLTSGTVTVQPVTGALGTVTQSLPAASGTYAVSASAPIVLNATTGALTAPTSVTSAAAVTNQAVVLGSGGGQGVSSSSTTDNGTTFALGEQTSIASPFMINVTGDTTTATGLFVKNSAGTVVKVATGDRTTGVALGICVVNCGVSGTQGIAIYGLVNCVFDNASTAGHLVQPSSTTAGDCKDSGQTSTGNLADASQPILGTVWVGGSAGSQQMILYPPGYTPSVNPLFSGNVQTPIVKPTATTGTLTVQTIDSSSASVPGKLTVRGGNSSGSGQSNQVGAVTEVDGSLGSGNATPGVVIIGGAAQGTASGTTAQTLVNREVINATKQLTSGSATTLVSTPLASLATENGILWFGIDASDGTNQCSLAGEMIWSGENSAGTFVTNSCTILNSQNACTATKTLTATCTVTGANPSLVQITPTLTGITATTFRITYQSLNLSQQLATF